MKKHVIAVAMYLVTLTLGLFLGSYFKSKPESAPPCPEKVQSGTPVRPTQFNNDRPEQKTRPQIIAEFLSKWHETKARFNRLSKFDAKDPDSFGGEIQALYRVGEDVADLRKTMEINQLSLREVDVNHYILRRMEAQTYRRVLDAVYRLKKMGGSNRCLFEGGCMNDAEEIGRIDSHLTLKVLNLE